MSWFRAIWEEMNRPLFECRACNGAGKIKIGHFDMDCSLCNGEGVHKHFGSDPKKQKSTGPKTTFVPPFWNLDNTCPDCGGEGWVHTRSPSIFFAQKESRQTCGKCKGTGYL